MTGTKYDARRQAELAEQRRTIIKTCESIVGRAKAAGRELTGSEQEAVTAGMAKIDDTIDPELATLGKAMVSAVLGLGSSEDFLDGGPDSTRFLSLRTPRLKSDLTARFGSKLGTPGVKAWLDAPGSVADIPMDPQPYRQSELPTSLIEVLPAVTRPVVYRYMRQTTRQNNAAPVASGGLKPTSVYGLTPVEGRLRVIAHVSEPVDKFVLRDGPTLADFVLQEMVAGLHTAVETQVVSGNGVGENLTGLANTSGIQTQALTANAIRTARAAITKVEVLGLEAYYYALNPQDWETVETSANTSGTFVLNAEGSRSGVPVDSAQRRLWGVPVTVTTAVPAGTGYLLSNGAVQLVTDGALATEQSNATGDDFSRNQVRLLVEGRFDLAVTRPLGVVKMTLA